LQHAVRGSFQFSPETDLRYPAFKQVERLCAYSCSICDLTAKTPTLRLRERVADTEPSCQQPGKCLNQILCRLGANPDTRADPTNLPLLAYTIYSAEYEVLDTTPTLIALLAAGADPHGVPKGLWQDYLQAPARSSADESTDAVSLSKWRTVEVEDALCRTIKLMQIYSLWKADKLQRPTPRMEQFALAYKFTPLFEVPFNIIGQMPATEQVLESITSHCLFGPSDPEDTAKPLVLLFTGQSGHGKTELARQIGSLLSVPMVTVDCAEMEREHDLFGAKPQYQAAGTGSPLNEHLVTCSGQRSVVFLENFDKTLDDVRKALLILFQSGAYVNRRNREKLDCSKTIWILATNHGEKIVNKFWDDHFKDRDIVERNEVLFEKLNALLRDSFVSAIGAPMTGRVTAIVPFGPFTVGEQAVMVGKYLQNLGNKLRQPIDILLNKFAGHTHLKLINDGQIAQHVAKHYYMPEIGARSLDTAVDTHLKYKLARAIQAVPELVTVESNDKALERYDVRLATVLEGAEEITVKRCGSTDLRMPPGKTVIKKTARGVRIKKRSGMMNPHQPATTDAT
jgi:Ni2+-binding GTPase involved in maturation of urease and hydrogenase